MLNALLVALALVLVAVRGPAAAAGEVEHNLEALVGKVSAELMAAEYGTIDNPLLRDWVDRVGQRVAKPSPRQEFPYRFRVLDTPESNAFSLPAAHIFVTRGLLATVESDDDLAAVLAHEVAHVADRDFQRIVARQLMFLGLATIIERMDEEEWKTPLYVVQVFNTLRHSRRQEDQADERGLRFALRARYDPLAATFFLDQILGERTRPKPWYAQVFETHPDAYRRRARCVERTRKLEEGEPEGVLALADDLAARGRHATAIRSYQRARDLLPESAAPLIGLARAHLARGEREECRRAAEAARQRSPEHGEAQALIAEAERLPAPGQVPPLPQRAATALPPVDAQAVKRLRRLTRGLGEQRRIDDALSWAQLVDVELGDPRWAYLVAKGRLLLMAVDRLRWRLEEVSRLSEGGARSWAEVSESADEGRVREAVGGYNEGVRTACRAAEDLRAGAQVLVPLIASLAATGPRDPLGRMSGARFAMMEADLLVAENHVRRALSLSRRAAREVAQAESERLELVIDGLDGRAGKRQRAIYERLAVVRLGLAPEEVRAGGEGLGAQCRAQAEGRAGGAATYEQAEAVRLVLRLLAVEMGQETAGEGDGNGGRGTARLERAYRA